MHSQPQKRRERATCLIIEFQNGGRPSDGETSKDGRAPQPSGILIVFAEADVDAQSPIWGVHVALAVQLMGVANEDKIGSTGTKQKGTNTENRN